MPIINDYVHHLQTQHARGNREATFPALLGALHQIAFPQSNTSIATQWVTHQESIHHFLFKSNRALYHAKKQQESRQQCIIRVTATLLFATYKMLDPTKGELGILAVPLLAALWVLGLALMQVIRSHSGRCEADAAHLLEEAKALCLQFNIDEQVHLSPADQNEYIDCLTATLLAYRHVRAATPTLTEPRLSLSQLLQAFEPQPEPNSAVRFAGMRQDPAPLGEIRMVPQAS